MDSLLPSEIARLVYGYLVENNCESAAQLFLETSDHLKECYAFQKKGRKVATKVMGLSLDDIINQYTYAVSILKDFHERKSTRASCKDNEMGRSEVVNVVQDLSDALQVRDADGTTRTIFMKISIPSKKERSVGDDNPGKGEDGRKTAEENHHGQWEKLEQLHVADVIFAETTSSSTDDINLNKNATRIESPVKKVNRKKVDQPIVEHESYVTTVSKSVSSSVDDFDLTMLQTLLDNNTLHERIAEKINKAIDSSRESRNIKTNGEKIVETVLHSTESDPIFDELARMLAAPRSEDGTTPEDTDKENGDPTEKGLNLTPAISQEQETIKRLEAENNLAIQEIISNNKSQQEDTLSGVVTEQCSSLPQMIANVVSSSDLPISGEVTPFQSIAATNVQVIGYIPPILPEQKILIPVSSLTRNFRGPFVRRRRLAPKPDNVDSTVLHVSVNPNPDEIIHATSPPVMESDLRRDLKRPSARTRGGISKTGSSRSVKAVKPQVSNSFEDNVTNINVFFAENTPSTKIITRSRFKSLKNEKDHSMESTAIPDEVQQDSPPRADQPSRCENQLGETETQLLSSKNCCSDVQEQSSRLNEGKQVSNCSAKDESQNEQVESDSQVQEQSTSLKKRGRPPKLRIRKSQLKQQDQTNRPRDQTVQKLSSTNEEIVNLDHIEKLNDKLLDPKPGNSEEVASESRKDDAKEGTPNRLANVVDNGKRVSLSTPRRQSHIRVLDFKTPEKSVVTRKSFTSPKSYSKLHKSKPSIGNVKRGIFRSPDVKEHVDNISEKVGSLKDQRKQQNNDWDQKLRQFVSADVDIPSSVGLKRNQVNGKKNISNPPKKNVTKKKLTNRKTVKTNTAKRKTARKKPEKKISYDNEQNELNESISLFTSVSPVRSSSEDLVKRIEQDVRDVISEDDINLNSSFTSNTGDKEGSAALIAATKSHFPSCSDTLEIPEEERSENIPIPSGPTHSELDSTIEKTPLNKSSEESNSCDLQRSVEDSQFPLSTTSIPDLKSFENTEKLEDGVSENIREERKCSSPLVTPPRLTLSPTSPVTPASKAVLHNSGGKYTDFVSSYHVQIENSLESILIKESRRLEEEKLPKDIKKPGNPNEEISGGKTLDSSTESGGEKRDISVNSLSKENPFQTPAKIQSTGGLPDVPVESTPISKAQPGFSVELTPCTKVLNSTNKFISTALVTTLPLTPNPRSVRTSVKSDDILNAEDDSGNVNVEQQIDKDQIDRTPVNTVLLDEHETLSSDESQKDNLNTIEYSSDESLESECSKTHGPTIQTSTLSATPKIKLVPQTPEVTSKLNTPSSRKVFSSSESSQDDNSLVENNESSTLSKKLLPRKQVAKDNNRLKVSPKKVTVSSAKCKLKSGNNKSSEKKTKPSRRQQKSPYLPLLKEEEEVLKECLERVKAKSRSLFGVISSDSSDNSISNDKDAHIPPTIRDQPECALQIILNSPSSVQKARNKMKKIKSLSMLDSSSGSDDEDIQTSFGNLIPNKKTSSKEELPTKSVENSRLTSLENVDPTSIKVTNSDQILSSKKFNDNVKQSIRDREESCESFPILYLSEESNISVALDPQKPSKRRKSPSVTNDLVSTKKALNSGLSGPCVSPGSIIVDPTFATSKDIDQQNNIPTISAASNISSCSRGIGGKDSYEAVIYKSPNCKTSGRPFVLVEDSKTLSQYLDYYTFCFSLDSEETEGIVTKTLRTSPYFSIFELDLTHLEGEEMLPEGKGKSTLGSSPTMDGSQSASARITRKNPEIAISNSQSHTHTRAGTSRSSSTVRTSERPGSLRSSKNNNNKSQVKSDLSKSSSATARARTSGTPTSPERKKYSPNSKSEAVKSHFQTRYGRDKIHKHFKPEWQDSTPTWWSGGDESPERFHRGRIPSPQRDRSRKRRRSESSSDDDMNKYPRFHGPSWGYRRGGQFRSCGRRFPKRRRDFRDFPHFSDPHISEKSFSRQKESSSRRKDFSEDIRRTHRTRSSRDDMFSHHSKDTRNNFNDSLRSSGSDRHLGDQSFKSSDQANSSHGIARLTERTPKSISMAKLGNREDGELSDTSVTEECYQARAAKRKELIALMKDDSRTSLLKGVDLDRFLTLLHGDEK